MATCNNVDGYGQRYKLKKGTSKGYEWYIITFIKLKSNQN